MAPPANRANYAPGRGASPVNVGRTVQLVLGLLALGVLAVATVIAFSSLLEIVIWLESRYVPVARAVLPIGVGVLALSVVRLVVRKRVA